MFVTTTKIAVAKISIEKIAQRAKFWALALGRPAAAPTLAVHSNDNQPGFRRPADGRHLRAKQTLACHWYLVDGRLQCRWEIEGTDGPLNRVRASEPARDSRGLRPAQVGRNAVWLRATG